MTIATSARTAGPYTGTGAVSVYPFSFKVFQGGDLLVTSTDTAGVISTLVLSSGYSVTLNADQDVSPGGTVNLTAALPSGYRLNISSAVSATQPVSLTNGGGFFPKVIEGALDRLTILLQQLGIVGLVQALRVPEIGGVPALPEVATRAGKLLGFDTNGNPAAIASASQDASGLALALLGQSGSSQVGFVQFGTGAVATTVQAKSRQSVSVFDFMTAAQIADAQAGTLLLDCAAAFRAAIDSFPATLDGNGYSYAGEVLIPPGKFRIDSTLTLKRQVKLTGCGSPAGNAYGACQLHFADNIDGIVCFYQYAASPSNGSDGALLTGFSIINRGGGGGTLGSGVVMNARVNVQRVLVKGFRVDGFQVIADSSVAPGFNNANNWRMQDCSAVSNGRHGLYTDGGDANAGNCLGFDARSNGGWGIFDSSFLGNNYVGCHTAANTLGAYKSDGASARNVFIGCYSESGQPASDILAPSIVVGGIHSAGFTTGTTAQMMVEGYQTSSVCYQNNNFNSATERQIVFAPPSALLSLKDPNESSGISPMRLKGTTGRFYWDWANDTKSLFEFTNSQATVANGFPREVATRMGGNAGVAMRQGYFVGLNMKHVTTGTAAPVAGTYERGDIVYNEAPASAGFVGWVCTAAGTPGTWKTFGLIS